MMINILVPFVTSVESSDPIYNIIYIRFDVSRGLLLTFKYHRAKPVLPRDRESGISRYRERERQRGSSRFLSNDILTLGEKTKIK